MKDVIVCTNKQMFFEGEGIFVESWKHDISVGSRQDDRSYCYKCGSTKVMC